MRARDNLRAGAILLCLTAACGPVESPTATQLRAADSDVLDAEAVTQAAAELRQAYDEGLMRAHRKQSTTLLRDLARRNGPEVAEALEGLTAVVAEFGVDGLEPVLLSVLARLESSPDLDVEARAELRATLAEVYWVQGKTRPHQYGPIARPGGPLIHHVRLPFVRRALQQMLIDPSLRGLDGAFEDGLCSEAGLAELEQRYGGEMATNVQALCEGSTGGGGVGGSAGFPGLPGSLSDLDCVSRDEPTRAERVNAAMLECFESLNDQGNPLAGEGGGTGGTPPGGTGAPPGGTAGGGTGANDTGNPGGTGTPGGTASPETIEPTATVDPKDLKYIRFKKGKNGVNTVVLELWDGTKHTVAGHSGADHRVFGNMAPGTEKILVVRRGKSSPGPDGGSSSDACAELDRLLGEVDEDLLSEDGPPLDTVINPGPDGVDDHGTDDCFGDDELTIDASGHCNDELVHCPEGELPDADCNCGTPEGEAPTRPCGVFMICLDGEADEQCSCTGTSIEFGPEVPTDGGPLPDPAFEEALIQSVGGIPE